MPTIWRRQQTTQTLFVYQPTSFVIWDGNAPTAQAAVPNGQRFLFWSAQWAKQLTAGACNANASFKGYANQVASTQWQAAGGNSSSPPASVGGYVGVIVTTQASRSGELTLQRRPCSFALQADVQRWHHAASGCSP